MNVDLIELIDDEDVIDEGNPEDTWVYNKLKLAKFLGYKCGGRNETPIFNKNYIIRPITNPDGMGIGAQIANLTKDNFSSIVKEDFFWCEIFEGRHISYDFEYGKNILTVEGIKQKSNPLWKWDKWKKIDERIELPKFLKPQSQKYRWINFESIGGNIIEVHLRPNKDFLDTDYQEVIPVWNKTAKNTLNGYKFVESATYKRIGFFVK